MAEYRFTETSEYEMDQIWTYLYLNATEQVADRQLSRLRDSFRLLAQNPGMGVSRPDYGIGIRRHNVPGTLYFVLYRLEEDAIEIMRVAHGSSNSSEIFE